MEGHHGDGVDSAPLSDSQRSVWVAQRLDPSSPVYHECALWRIDGDLDAGALRDAIVAATVRQPMLRTRFVQKPGEGPRQQVDREPRVALERVALDDASLDDAVQAHARVPFDLAAGAPIRWVLYMLGPRRHALLRVWHHIISDGASNGVLSDDIAKAYAERVAGRPAVLPPLVRDYLDFTRRQQDPAWRQAREADVAYWTSRLAGAPTLALPTDFHRPPSRTLRGAVVASQVPRASVDGLRAVARRAKVTPYSMFVAAYAALLSRLSGDDEIVVGMAVGGRPGLDYEDVLGFFAQMVACRVDLSGAKDTVAAGTHAYERVHEAIAHHQVPLERIVEALGIHREAARQPLFQAAFGLRRAEVLGLPLAGVDVRREDVELGHARFDLTLSLAQGSDGMTAYWNYATDLFSRATIERMGRQYAALVDAMGREPDRPLATLPLMDEATRSAVVARARGADTPMHDATTVHARFAAQARRSPDARAVGALTYGALDAASGRLAAELAARGARRGTFVAVARDRAADIAVAWLAVLKSGAAYVPIDPALPDERLRSMLADASVVLGIADDATASKLGRCGVAVLRPDAEAARIAAHAPMAAVPGVGAEDPAYAIYTSGSTGRAKAVVVPHRAILGLVCGADYAPLGPHDVVAQLAPPAFDASTFEFWGPLCHGASIAPIDKATALSPRALAAALASQGVTTLFLTTALFEAVAREMPSAFATCATVMFGGEACDPRRVAEVLRAGPPQRLVHVYGPTETTTFATFHEVREVDPAATTVPIGRAIAHAEAFVLRPDGEPCAPGEPGELVVGGTGVALGYLGAGEADARRFVTAPVAGLPARRLYRTGDRARALDDGAIEFLGRVDDQVKVLGHRIELGEIEAAIARHPGVSGAAAILRGATSDTRRVVAYAVPANPAAPPPDDLRRSLRSQLPVWMLPAEIVWVPALPLNASGKVDRRALPDVSVPSPSEAKIRVPPRDPLEKSLLGRWEALLGRQGLSVYDHFFDVGGNSLAAARMVDEYERDTGVRVPLSALFIDDTVAGLARAIREGSLDASDEVVGLHERGERPPFVFVHGDFFTGGFHSHTLARLLGPSQPIYAVHPHGIAGGGVPETIEAMAAERRASLLALRPDGPFVISGHCNGAFVAFELARQLIDAGVRVPAVIIIDAPAPKDVKQSRDREWMREEFGRNRLGSPSDRTADLALRLHAAMRGYAPPPIDTHLVYVQSEQTTMSGNPDRWAELATSAEVRVLPGDHRSVVMEQGGELFCAVVRDVIDRAEAPRR